MKVTRRILVVGGCALILALGHASAADPAIQQRSGNSTPTAGRPSDQKQAPTANQSKNRKEASAGHEHSQSGQAVNKAHVRNQTKLPMPSRPKQARNIRGHSHSQPALHAAQPTFNQARTDMGKIVKAHTPASRPSTGLGIGGQQFRHVRNPAAVPTALGASARARGNTQVINGSEVHRRY